MRADKVILAVLSFCIIVRFLVSFPLDNSTIPGGTDVAHFLTNTWYIATFGMTKWNFFWYGGFPFMRYYPPLAFLITGGLARLVGVLMAYKLVNDLFVVLVPLSFYFFMKEFELSKEKQIVALLTFSFIPISAYFLADGRFPTLINVFFSLLYWKFLKRSLDSKRYQDAAIASIFLSLSLITHHTTTFLFILISSAWAIIYKTDIETIKKLLAIGILTVGFTAWWSGPFFLETLTTSNAGLYVRTVGSVYAGNIIYRVETSVLVSAFYTSSIEPLIIVALAVIMGIISLLALTRYREKTTRDFILLSIFIAAMILLIRYERSVIFFTIPLAFIMAEGLSTLKKNMRIVATCVFLVMLIASYALIRPQIFDMPVYPNIPRDGRVIFFPIGSEYDESQNQVKNYFSVILSPMNGQENIFGWHDESQLVGSNAANKESYLSDVRDPFSMNKTDYYNLLSAAYINYVVVNRNDTEALNYFNDSMFRQISSDKMFVSFQLNPESTYVEMNNQPVQSEAVKIDDRIYINTTCQVGNITVKESYHKMWNAEIDGKSTQVSFNQYGFMTLISETSGICSINLVFKDPSYYLIFYAVSILSMMLVFIYLLVKYLKIRRKE